MEEKKSGGGGTFELPLEIENIYTLIFYFIQTRLGETQQDSGWAILQCPGLILRGILSSLKHQSRDSESKFFFFEIRNRTHCLFYFVFFPLLPTTCCCVPLLLPFSDSTITTYILSTDTIFSHFRI